MTKISILGPQGTFSEIATKKYCEILGVDALINYHSSIMKVASSFKDDDLMILPLENTLDGYVQETLDILLQNNYEIICDLQVPVDFTFIGNSKEIKDIKSVYVQFKAEGQCQDFLLANDFKIIKTQSNIESLDLFLKSDNSYGAIVPYHKGHEKDFPLIKESIKDKENNFTRFIVVSRNQDNRYLTSNIKCSMCVYALIDKPGVLFNLLKKFNDESINLGAIMSKPTKLEMGTYNFYIEFNAKIEELSKINRVIEDLENTTDYQVKVLGIYSYLE